MRVMVRRGGGSVSPSTVAMARASAHTAGDTKAYEGERRASASASASAVGASLVGACASVVGTALAGAAPTSPTTPVVVMSRSATVVAIIMSCTKGPPCVVTGSRVDTPDTLTINEPAFLPARV